VAQHAVAFGPLSATSARKLGILLVECRVVQPFGRFAWRGVQRLAGIVFGVNTSEADKVRIIKMIKEKCRSEGHASFDFYQTRYFREDRAFSLTPVSLF
jgi:hypothetical protein